MITPQITKKIAAGAIHDSTVQNQRFSMRPANFTFAACSSATRFASGTRATMNRRSLSAAADGAGAEVVVPSFTPARSAFPLKSAIPVS